MPLPERSLISRITRLSRRQLILSEKGNRKAGSGGATLNDRKWLSQIGRARVVKGVGDDCAVLRPAASTDLLVTTDFSLEGVHFRHEWHPPGSVGHRCIARGLSDIAAMGGEPVAAFLSLAIPAKLPQSWADKFLMGLLKLAGRFGVVLAGGDTSQSLGGILADIVVLGSVAKGKAILRSTARPGDHIYVTGLLGESAAALGLLYSKKKIDPKKFPRHFFPMPRIQVAQILRSEKIPTSMIDLSDGLSTDLSHICEESGVGAEIWANAIPRAKIGSPPELVDFELALHGGEDYELLFTASPNKPVPERIAGVPITCIGEITRNKRMILIDEDGSRSILKPRGWEHLRA